jgi:putative transposase
VPSDEELCLRAFLRDFSRRHPRWGWRRAAAAAKKEGWRVNHKRVHRLWRDEGLRVPYRKKKRPLRGIGVPVGAERVVCPRRGRGGCLERLAAERGAPAYVRFDHRPEFIAYAVADWCRFNGTGTVFIDPGSPWQNAWIESFNGRLRDEFLSGHLFETVLEAQVLLEGVADRVQQRAAPQRARLAITGRVRRGVAQTTPATARIAGGPSTGSGHGRLDG